MDGVWANSEIDKAKITKKILWRRNGAIGVLYFYEPLSNGARFSLLMTLMPKRRDVEFRVIADRRSKAIEAFSLGNYYGIKDRIRFLRPKALTYDALLFCEPDDGNFVMGDFYAAPVQSLYENTVIFWGENKVVQKQYFDVPMSNQDVLMFEIRRHPWIPDQPDPGHNWIEAVHLTREPFTPEKSVWHFGFEDKIGDSDPYPRIQLPCPH